MTGKIKKDIKQHYSFSKNYFIVFNGEIYNHIQIRQKYNYNYLTKSDCEVIIPLYIKYGEKCVDYLDDIQRNKKDDTKFAKELEECSDKGIEISQECKEYYRRKFEWQEKTMHFGTFKR